MPLDLEDAKCVEASGPIKSPDECFGIVDYHGSKRQLLRLPLELEWKSEEYIHSIKLSLRDLKFKPKIY